MSTTCRASWPMRSRLSGRGTHSSRSSNMRFGHLAPEFQSGDGLFPSDRREAVEKLVQSISSLEMVVQGFHWHPGAHEHWGTAQDVRVAVNDLGRIRHGWHPDAQVYASSLR